MVIREAQNSDCINLAALSIKVWLDTYAVDGIRTEYSSYVLSTFNESYFLKLLSSSNCRLFVSENEKILQGFILVNLDSHFKTQDNGFEIEKLYVDENIEGQGIGKSLLEEVKKKIGTNFWLHTWVENESNNFYKHLGFTHIGQLEFEFSGHTLESNVYKSGSA